MQIFSREPTRGLWLGRFLKAIDGHLVRSFTWGVLPARAGARCETEAAAWAFALGFGTVLCAVLCVPLEAWGAVPRLSRRACTNRVDVKTNIAKADGVGEDWPVKREVQELALAVALEDGHRGFYGSNQVFCITVDVDASDEATGIVVTSSEEGRDGDTTELFEAKQSSLGAGVSSFDSNDIAAGICSNCGDVGKVESGFPNLQAGKFQSCSWKSRGEKDCIACS